MEPRNMFDGDDDDEIVMGLAWYWEQQVSSPPPRNIVHPHRTRGEEMVGDMLYNVTNDRMCRDWVRMNKTAFIELCRQAKLSGLKDSRGVSVEQQLMIFCELLGHGTSVRKLGHEFSHSEETIHRHIYNVYGALEPWFASKINNIVPLDVIPNYIRNSTMYWPWFKDCVGAIDGTHVMAKVAADVNNAYRGKEKNTTQNVMCVCDFSMRFTYVVTGWEGSAHDQRVLDSALQDPTSSFPMPPCGKYYVVDAGYAQKVGFLGPYKGTGQRYHIAQFQQRRPSGRNETYNYRHASLRNIVERAFGALKKRWHILDNMPTYPIEMQAKLVYACAALHNFVHEHHHGSTDPDMRDWLLPEFEGDAPYIDNSLTCNANGASSSGGGEDQMQVNDDRVMLRLRDAIRDAIADSLNIQS